MKNTILISIILLSLYSTNVFSQGRGRGKHNKKVSKYSPEACTYELFELFKDISKTKKETIYEHFLDKSKRRHEILFSYDVWVARELDSVQKQEYAVRSDSLNKAYLNKLELILGDSLYQGYKDYKKSDLNYKSKLEGSTLIDVKQYIYLTLNY